MIAIEKEDWDELVRLLKQTEEGLSNLNGGDCEKELEQFRQSLQSFHTTAAMFGLASVERAGLELEEFLSNRIAPSRSVDDISAFGFAVSSLIDQMHGEAESINVDEIIGILGPSAGGEKSALPAGCALASGSKDCAEGLSLLRLRDFVKSCGGELSIVSNGTCGGQFNISFTGSGETLQNIEKFLCASGPDRNLTSCTVQEPRLEKIVAKGREFMDAFSGGEFDRAQEILLNLSDQQYQTGLYKEIGSLARGLHDSIRTFLGSLDPSFKEMVEDKIPDTGNRLEHMMELTEKAAITTLDHVEAMQERLASEQEQVAHLRELLGGLNALGDGAGKKLENGCAVLGVLEDIIARHREDLDVILTAQDYQDLSGQIILKISKLLKDMELKLVNLIRTFGVRSENKPNKDVKELYGPAHPAREESVRSQDEVDSLLAEFGF